VDSDEEADEINDNSEDVDANRGKPRDFDFDADVMQDQRILDTDAVLRFESNPSSDHLLSTDDPYETPNFTEGDVQNGSWQFQNPNRIKQKIKRIIRRELNRDDAMSEEDASKVIRRMSLSQLLFSIAVLCIASCGSKGGWLSTDIILQFSTGNCFANFLHRLLGRRATLRVGRSFA